MCTNQATSVPFANASVSLSSSSASPSPSSRELTEFQRALWEVKETPHPSLLLGESQQWPGQQLCREIHLQNMNTKCFGTHLEASWPSEDTKWLRNPRRDRYTYSCAYTSMFEGCGNAASRLCHFIASVFVSPSDIP